jgi:Protein of unknown function (DUF2865)
MFPSILISTLRRAAVLCVPALLLAMPTPGHAQSFFETLFGGAKPTAPAPNFSAPSQRLAPAGGLASGQNSGPQSSGGGSSYRAPVVSPNRSARDDDDDGGQSKGGKGGHRTVCVRLCDGYYWPVNFEAKRSQFPKEARSCQSSCDGEAKLFHYPNHGDINDAVDNSGKPYARLPAAFLYRKKLVAGCTCRAEAWSDAEVSRHQAYALNEAQYKARKAEQEAAEVARIAAADAAGQQSAEAKLLAKNGGPKAKKATAVAAATAVEPGTSDATANVVVAGSATVASAPGAVVGTNAAAIDAVSVPPASKARPRRSREVVRDVTSAPIIRTAAAGRTPRPQQANNPVKPQPAYASAGAAPGLFAKKHTWPGD